MVGLRPIKHPIICEFVRNKEKLLNDMLTGYSSPLHIIFPQIFVENIDKFRNVLSSHGVEENIFFSCKANKSNALIEAASHSNIGLEASSYYELRNALGIGIQGSKIIVGGPGKAKKYLLLAIRCGATISVDSNTELANIIGLCKKSRLKAKILLRISNDLDKSRFGIDIPISNEILSMVSNKDVLDLTGFSGHFNNYDIAERPKLIKKLMELCKRLKKLGYVNCNIIDIGGGFTISYTTEDEWKNFDAKKEDFWNNKTFGHFYPYYSKYSGSDGLKYSIEQLDEGKHLFELLKDDDFKLFIEPGQALLDQVGITLMRITDVKKKKQGTLVVVDGNINHLSEQWFDTDFLLSPELISFGKNEAPFEGYIGGNTCIEEDMVSWHKIRFDNTPSEGDVLVFYNTAGYIMDSNESDFMRMPIPKKVCAIRRQDLWVTYNDEIFNQADFLEESV